MGLPQPVGNSNFHRCGTCSNIHLQFVECKAKGCDNHVDCPVKYPYCSVACWKLGGMRPSQFDEGVQYV
jgi:hypothetical protein